MTGSKKHLKAGIEATPLAKSHEELLTDRSKDAETVLNGLQLNGSAFTAVLSPKANDFIPGFYSKAPSYLKSKSQPASLVAVSQNYSCTKAPQSNYVTNSGLMPAALRRRLQVTNINSSPMPSSNSMSALSSFQQQILSNAPPTPPQRTSIVDQLRPKLLAAQHFNLHVSPTLSPALPPSQPPVALRYPKVSPPTKLASFQNSRHVSDLQLHQISLIRGSRGYGFTVSGTSPVYISHVETNSPAHLSGVRVGDFIIKIDQINVSKSSTETVVRMFRMAPHSILLTVLRQVNTILSGPFTGKRAVPLSFSTVTGRQVIGNTSHEIITSPRQRTSVIALGTSIHDPFISRNGISVNPEITMVTNNLLNGQSTVNNTNMCEWTSNGNHSSIDEIEQAWQFDLIELGARLPVKVLLNKDRLMITQLQSNNVLQLIRQPIEFQRICYVNLPANAPDQLIIQYMDHRKSKQMIHLQGSSVIDCCHQIRSRLPYVGNWTMSCKDFMNGPKMQPHTDLISKLN